MADSMFYSEYQIQREFLCSICRNQFDVPKVLECGESICSYCEHYYFSVKSKCHLCSNFHEKPPSGFPVNQLITRFLKTVSPKYVYRGDLHEKAMKEVNNFGSWNRHFSREIENSKELVVNYCEVLRRDVLTKTGSVIGEINKQRDAFLDEINNYEHGCLVKCENEPPKFKEFAEKWNASYEKWVEFLKCGNISDSQITNVLATSTEQMKVLELMSRRFDKSIFGSRKPVFYENRKHTPANVIGKLARCINQTPENKFNYNTEKQVTACYNPYLVKINDETVCMVCTFKYNDENYQTKLSIITNGVITREVSWHAYRCYFDRCVVTSFKDSIVVHLFNSTGQYELRKYDMNLNLINFVYRNYPFSALFTDERLLYGFSKDNLFWAIFDKRLVFLESTDIEDGSVYPFIKHKDSQVELKYGCLFVYYNRELRVVDNEKRTLIASLRLDEIAFPNPTFVRPCTSDSFYVIDSESKKFKIFDFDRCCLTEFNVHDISQITSVSLTNDGDLVVYDRTETAAYLF